MSPEVAAAFHAAPAAALARMLTLREIILEAAARANAGEVAESLKWGEPAYRTKDGSTVRLGWKAKTPGEVAMYFICTTNLLQRFRDLYPDELRFGGERALLFDLASPLPRDSLLHCVAMALTYHRK